MVILFQRFGHTLKKMKQHHESSSDDELSASLHSFESEILNCLYSISFNSKPGSENYYSYAWIQKCLHQVLPNIDKAFAKFIADIDYPVPEWKTDIVDEYLQDNLSLLDHLNSISSSISHMAQACMNLLHALSLQQASSPIMLKPILPWCPKKKFQESKEEERLCSGSGKDFVTHQALLIRKLVRNWVCRIVDSSIRGEVVQTCLQLNKESNGIFISSLVTLQFGVCKEMKRKGVVKEVDEINRGVARVHAAAGEGGEGDETSELHKKVEVLGKQLEGIKEDVNKLFSGALVKRNELLDCLA